MIDEYINSLPSCNISHRDFPYIVDYYSYIIEKSTEGFKIPGYISPELVIKDTPYSESHFIESDHRNVIVFDISTSLQLAHISNVILTGDVTKDAWLALLGLAANIMLSLDRPRAALMFSLNRSYDFKKSLGKRRKNSNRPIFELTNDLDDAFDAFSGNIRCQEMFILAHEVTHYFITQNLYVLKRVPRYIYTDLIKDRGADPSTRIFLTRVLGFTGESTNEKNYELKLIRKIFFSKRFAEETLCDIKAAEITIEHFTWDRAHFSHAEVCASIQVAMRSYILASSLRLHLKSLFIEHHDPDSRDHNMAYEILLRTKVMDAYLSKKLKSHLALNCRSQEKQINEVVRYDVFLNEAIRKRTAAIEQCLFSDIKDKILALDDSFKYLDGEIEYPDTSALYYLGYDSPATRAQEFIESDGSLFLRKPMLREQLNKEAMIDLYKINEKSIKSALSIMNTTVF